MERGIIDEKFREWTGALSPEKSRINIFEKIRDIPFAVVPEFFSPGRDPAGILTRKRGFCVPKHRLLGIMFQKLGIPVRYCVCSFRWSELEVNYPPRLGKLAEGIPPAYHLACEVFAESRWVFVDATWDPSLKKAGFPVNEKWDGRSDTIEAVKPLEGFFREAACEEAKTFEERWMSYSLAEKLRLSRFSRALNIWLEEIRQRA